MPIRHFISMCLHADLTMALLKGVAYDGRCESKLRLKLVCGIAGSIAGVLVTLIFMPIR